MKYEKKGIKDYRFLPLLLPATHTLSNQVNDDGGRLGRGFWNKHGEFLFLFCTCQEFEMSLGHPV